MSGRILCVVGAMSIVVLGSTQRTAGQACVSSEGLVGYWPGDGTGADLWAAQDGVEVGGVNYAEGVCKQAFSFNGSSYLEVAVPPGADLDLGDSDSVTMACWVYPHSSGGMHVLGKRSGCGGAIDFYQLPINYGHVTVSAHEWHHVAVTYDDAGVERFYLDGSKVGESAGGGTWSKSVSSFRIGTSGDCSAYTGLVDEVLVFSRALGDREIAILAEYHCSNVCDIPGWQRPLPRLTLRVSEVEICWQSRSNEVYQVQRASQLTAQAWENMGEAVIGDGLRQCIRAPILREDARRQYRLIIPEEPDPPVPSP